MKSIQPVIFDRVGNQRDGRGFSREELKQVGLTAWTAQRIGLSVDLRRGSTYEVNVEMLKEYLDHQQEDLAEKIQASKVKKEIKRELKLKREQEKPIPPKKKAPPVVKEVVLDDVKEDIKESIPMAEETTPLTNLEDITSKEIDQLMEQDIEFAEDLLGLSSEDIDEIAESSSMNRDRVATLVFQAVDQLEPLIPLRDVPGIGEKTADLLECSGIFNANTLARTSPNTHCDGISGDRLKKFIDKAWDKILND